MTLKNPALQQLADRYGLSGSVQKDSDQLTPWLRIKAARWALLQGCDGIDLSERETRFIAWILGWDSDAIENLTSLVTRLRGTQASDEPPEQRPAQPRVSR